MKTPADRNVSSRYGATHKIAPGDRIGWSRRAKLACCASCWTSWTAENDEADRLERNGY